MISTTKNTFSKGKSGLRYLSLKHSKERDVKFIKNIQKTKLGILENKI